MLAFKLKMDIFQWLPGEPTVCVRKSSQQQYHNILKRFCSNYRSGKYRSALDPICRDELVMCAHITLIIWMREEILQIFWDGGILGKSSSRLFGGGVYYDSTRSINSLSSEICKKQNGMLAFFNWEIISDLVFGTVSSAFSPNMLKNRTKCPPLISEKLQFRANK